jgi:hypothetical protein
MLNATPRIDNPRDDGRRPAVPARSRPERCVQHGLFFLLIPLIIIVQSLFSLSHVFLSSPPSGTN